MITLLLKTTVASLLLCNVLLSDHTFADHRGSIISNDGQILAESDSDQKRFYSHDNSMEPILGFVRSNEEGIIGIEQYMNAALVEGMNVHLTIDLSLQKEVNKIADSYKKNLNPDEVLVTVMESATGKVLTMATSNRYNANYITQKDIPNLEQ